MSSRLHVSTVCEDMAVNGGAECNISNIKTSCYDHRRTYIGSLHPHTHTHIHLLSKLPPCINTNTHKTTRAGGLNWICSEFLSMHLPAYMPAPTKPGPSPFGPALRVSSTSSSSLSQQNTRSAPLSPVCLLSLTLAECAGAWWGLGIGARGTYGLVRRLLHGGGSSASKHCLPPPPSLPSPPSSAVFLLLLLLSLQTSGCRCSNRFTQAYTASRTPL